MAAVEGGLAAEIDKKTAPPPFERLPTETPDRASLGRVLSDQMIAMRDGVLPPTANLKTPDDGFNINLVPIESQERVVNHAMKLSLGFGGHLVAASVCGAG